MAIGNTPNATQLNQMASAVAVQLRNAAQAAQRLADYVNSQGLAGLQTDNGFDADDAAAFLATLGPAGLGQLTGLFFGTETLATATDFSALLQTIAGPA